VFFSRLFWLGLGCALWHIDPIVDATLAHTKRLLYQAVPMPMLIERPCAASAEANECVCVCERPSWFVFLPSACVSLEMGAKLTSQLERTQSASNLRRVCRRRLRLRHFHSGRKGARPQGECWANAARMQR
jgi:hypothetical protein